MCGPFPALYTKNMGTPDPLAGVSEPSRLAANGEGIGLDELSILGPILVLKLKQSPHGFDRQLVGEAWFYPDGSRILELSTKCEPSEAFQVAAETRAFLSSRGIDLESEQQTKTRTALEFFSKNLGA